MNILPPGSTIGILGGGQLGRMTALAAARLGYRSHIFCPEMDAPALQVAAGHTRGDFLDHAALKKFAEAVDVVTLEWENVPLETLEVLSRRKPVHPNAPVLRIAQDRVLEKSFARQQGLGTPDFMPVLSVKELAEAMENFARPAILKTSRLGYDGKGQLTITSDMDAATAWRAMGSEAGIIETFIDFDREISVIVARRADGVMATYPVAENIHINHVLAETRVPARISPAVEHEAKQIAQTLAAALDVVGLLCVEMFVLKTPNAAGQSVLMNEIAPRPHNSGHWTIDACACSQFEQLVRAVCGLPLGPTTPHSRAVMQNILGDDVQRWPEYLADPTVCLHLYGKTEIRPGRKMAHMTRLGDKWSEA